MYLFTSEYVSPGHPDKVADIIADTIVQDIISHDKNARVASEVFVAGRNIIIGGEIKTSYSPDYKKIVKKSLKKIGYTNKSKFTDKEVIKPKNVKIQVLLNQQSPDISRGVDQENVTGAGDQGIMFGFATNETRSYMPAALVYAREICEEMYNFAKQSDDFGVDIKTQVTIDYGTKENFENSKPQKIHTVVVSMPCTSTMKLKKLRLTVKKILSIMNLPKNLFDIDDCILHINPTGRYVNHSPLHDSGLTGRKLIVDSYGGYASIGGGAQSSKDFTKVDRSGLYAARWVAKHIVAAGLATKCTVQLSYAIGIAKPVSVNVDTFGTCDKCTDTNLSAKITSWDLSPNWIINKFKLNYPVEFDYADVAARGQVGHDDYPWEKLDTDLLKYLRREDL